MTNKLTTEPQDETFRSYCNHNSVQPLPQNNEVNTPPPTAATIRQLTRATKNNNFANSMPAKPDLAFFGLVDPLATPSEYCNNGQQQIVKALRLGKYCIVASLDLHNYTQGEALALLEVFLENGTTHGSSCLKIVHGKGLNSPDGASVLKSLVRRFLMDYPRLVAYSKASPHNGGDGVTLVKLRNPKG